MKIILPIHPEYVGKIVNRVKRYEYRTTVPNIPIQDLQSILIYETAPKQKVVAEVVVLNILALPPEELWELTKNESGIDKAFFDSYFKDREIAYAYKLGRIKTFDTPKTLEEYGVDYVPQSFVYVGKKKR